MVNSPDYIKYIMDRGIRTDEEAAKHLRENVISNYEKHGFGFYVIRLKHMDFPIGSCGMLKRDHLDHIDIGYNLLEEFHGMGYAYEASVAVINHAKEYHNINHLIAVTSDINKSSQKLLKRLGFTFDKLITWTSGEELLQFEKDI